MERRTRDRPPVPPHTPPGGPPPAGQSPPWPLRRLPLRNSPPSKRYLCSASGARLRSRSPRPDRRPGPPADFPSALPCPIPPRFARSGRRSGRCSSFPRRSRPAWRSLPPCGHNRNPSLPVPPPAPAEGGNPSEECPPLASGGRSSRPPLPPVPVPAPPVRKTECVLWTDTGGVSLGSIDPPPPHSRRSGNPPADPPDRFSACPRGPLLPDTRSS